MNRSASGRHVRYARTGFEKCFLRKIRIGKSEPFHERLALKALGIDKLKVTHTQ